MRCDSPYTLTSWINKPGLMAIPSFANAFPIRMSTFDGSFPSSHVWGQTRETIIKMLRSTGDMSQSQAPGELAFSTRQRPKVGEAAGVPLWKTQRVIETLIYPATNTGDYYSRICRNISNHRTQPRCSQKMSAQAKGLIMRESSSHS